MNPSDVKYIVIHCSAGFAGREGIERYWKETLGWKSPGYHRLVETDGTIHSLAGFKSQVNGVRGYNDKAIHICYVGGVEKDGNGYKAKDTRTDAQKHSLQKCIVEAIYWLADHGKNVEKDLLVLGHRDFSNDKNANGIIESWERIKECPSFDAMQEYMIYSATNSDMRLPSNR